MLFINKFLHTRFFGWVVVFRAAASFLMMGVCARNKKLVYLKGKVVEELETNSKVKNIRYMYRGI